MEMQSDNTYQLTFSDSRLQNYFANRKVYCYKKAFPTARSEALKRTWYIGLDDSSAVTDLERLPNVELAEKVPVPFLLYAPPPPYYPNDYNILLNNTTAMDLIEVPLAWSITQGDTSVLIGISDTHFEPNHEDLQGKIVSGTTVGYNGPPFHGSAVAGAAVANTDNGKGVTGSAFNCRVVVSTNWANYDTLLRLSQTPGVKVINVSWGHCSSLGPTTKGVLDEIEENGVVIVAGAGNRHCGSSQAYLYPAAYDPVISVTSVGHVSPRGVGNSNWQDVHEDVIGDPNSTHTHNDKVDICAPGYAVGGIRTDFSTSNGYGNLWGTSFASPLVAGVCALMFSVNPCLAPSSVKDILLNTADVIDTIPENLPYAGLLGHGRVNAYKAVQEAQLYHSNSLDLFIKDRPNDFGHIYGWQLRRDNSPDIWVRNQADGFQNQEHQRPIYRPGFPVYVYVRVRNKSCVPAVGDEVLRVYWSKAATWSSWPQNWDGSNPAIGDTIGEIIIGNLRPGRDTIFEFEWYPPSGVGTWSVCLLARIEESPVDTITVYPNKINDDVYYNNNIAMKNTMFVRGYIVNSIPVFYNNPGIYNTSRLAYVGNPLEVPDTFSLQFYSPPRINNPSLTDVAEVRISFDSLGWEIIKNGIEGVSGIELTDEREIILRSELVKIPEIPFPPNTRVPIQIKTNFFVEKISAPASFDLFLDQYKLSGELLGGIHYIITAKQRTPFVADLHPVAQLLRGRSIMLRAQDIGEPAQYKWFDNQDSLIATGKNIWLLPIQDTTLKLEVTAISDAYKSVKNISLPVKDKYIASITPNPATNQITVNYEVGSANSSYLILTNNLFSFFRPYFISSNSGSKTISVQFIPAGNYTLLLMCDGIIVDSKNFIKY